MTLAPEAPRARLMRLAYRALTVLSVPLFIGHLAWRGVSNPNYRRRIPERFGRGLPPLAGRAIWVHAVSVGEVQAAAPLVRALLERHPEDPVLVTTVTPTGSQRVRELFGDRVVHTYLPFDTTGAVRRFFRWARPRLVVIMETELWPNLYHECGRRRVPLVLASARISPRSVRRYRRLVPLFRDTLSHGIVIAAQSKTDAARFRSLGASTERTHVTGNIKFDVELPADTATRGARFRERHAPGRPVWIAASTHEGEERAALAAHRQVLATYPDALLILVPRHPERFDAVATLLDDTGMEWVRRSSERACTAQTVVLLGDTMGELPMFYRAADLAFVGGSLVPVGGHNLLEPVGLGVPALAGPHQFNTADIAGMLLEAGVLETVDNADALAERVIALLGDPDERAHRSAVGRRVIGENRGSLQRLIELIDPLLAG